MIDAYTLKVGDKVRIKETEYLTLRGHIDAIAAGCAVIKWTHTKEFDPLRLNSQLWRFMERDE